jgi:hypothetical protein
MKEKRSPFFAYRYLVTPTSEQATITQQLNKPKEELIRDFIEKLATTTKTEWTKGKKRYLFYGSQHFENVYIIKYARETNENIYVEGENDINVERIKEAKFVYLFIDTEHQVILLERNQSVFSSIDNSVSVLADFLREYMREFDYVVNIYPLVSKRKFWNYVDSADEIYELTLQLNAPNMAFFGHEDTRDVLQQIKETINNEEFDLSFKNKEGRLRIVREALGSWIEYVREVGGRYILKFSSNGVTDTKTSETDTAKTYIPRKQVEKYDEEELANIKAKLESMHKLEDRDDEDEN